MANEFKVKNGLIVVGDLTTSGTITINGALAATQSWVTSQAYLTSSSLTSYATQTYVNNAVAALVDSAPGALDTLRELATALGNDASFSTTVTNSIAAKLPLAGGTLTGALLMGNGVAAAANSQPTALSYGLLQAYGTFTLAADTDGSQSEFAIITAGYGVASATAANGLAIGFNTLTWKNNTVWHAGNLTNLNQLTNGPGYLTSYTETDTLASVTGRGATTSTNISVNSVNIGTDATYGGAYRSVSFGYNGDGSNRILAANNTTDGMYFMAATGQGFNFRPNGGTANLVVINSSGNVGIGTTAPSTKLNIYSDTTADGILLDILSRPRITLRDRGNSDTIIGTGDYGLDDFFIDTYSGNALAIKGSTRNVGIGTSSPNEKLHVAGNINAYVNGGIDAGLFASTSAGSTTIALRSNGITHFNGGSVGIGTFSPTDSLSVQGNTNLGNSYGSTTSSTYTTRVSGYAMRYDASNRYGNYGVLILNADSGWTSSARRFMLTSGLNVNKFAIIRSVDSTTDPSFGDGGAISSGTADFVIDSAGNVGIGTTSPSTKLHVYNASAADTYLESGTSGTTGKLIFKTSDNSDLNKYIMQDSYWTLVGTHSNEGFRVRDSAGTVLMTVNGTTNAYPGRVGIGTTSPSYKLDVNGETRLGKLITTWSNSPITPSAVMYSETGYNTVIGGNGQFSTSYLALMTTGNMSYMGGNVGIGTDSPNYKLHVAGNSKVDGQTLMTSGFSTYTTDGLFSADALWSGVITPSGAYRVRFGYLDQGGGQYWGRIGFVANTNWSLGTAQGGTSFSIGMGNGNSEFLINNAGKVSIGTSDTNSDKSDFTVYTGSGASLALTDDQVRMGGADVNWGVALRSYGALQTYGQALTLNTQAGNYAVNVQPNGTTVAQFYQDYSYFPGLDFSISRVNGVHSSNYFRGDGSHLVIGTGGTLYLNYANTSGTTYIFGTTYINNEQVATRAWVGAQGYLTSVSDIWVNTTGDTMTGSLSFSEAAVIKKRFTASTSNPVKTASGVLASRSDNSGGSTYYIIETNVPQDDYQMGGFTIEIFGNYSSTNHKSKIDLGGYWNPETNGGFEGFEAHGSNPQYKPTIEVARNSSGKTVFIIYGGSWSYPVIVARDLWLGYSGSDGGTYGEGWSIIGTNDISSYVNRDTVVWRNAYSDSNPAGYITGYTETDTLQSVTSRGASTNTGLYINNNNPTLYLQDTDHRSAMIHVNSDYFYILNGSGTNSTGWAQQANSRWLFMGNLNNNDITFGGSGDFAGTVTASGGNSSNWNTAYGWGNHASAGYLTSVTAHTQAWSTITSTPTTISGYGITNAYTDAQIQNFFNGANAISGYNKSNWDTAYSWGNHASYSYATTSYVTTQINNLIAGAPGALDTLDELAAALGDDSNFATTVTNSIATKLPLAGGTMSGTILFVNDVGTALQGTVGINDFWRIYANSTTTNAGYLEIATSDDGTEPIYVRQYTGVFSNLTRTATLLDGAGNTSFPGNLNIGGFLTESSSLKLKENIEISEGNLEKVVNLRPVTYNKIGSQTTELGLIAEEVAEVYPEFVQYDENGEPIGVNYSRLTAALIGAVKELTNQVQELNKKING
jgi:hypothetical protein